MINFDHDFEKVLSADLIEELQLSRRLATLQAVDILQEASSPIVDGEVDWMMKPLPQFQSSIFKVAFRYLQCRNMIQYHPTKPDTFRLG